MPLFDAYLIVDWSANNSPKKGKDSIWIALAGRHGLDWTENLPTRLQAMQRIHEVIANALASGRRLFAGFDFAFGYPAGVAQIIGGSANWQSVWARLSAVIADDAANRSNAFEVAGELNERIARQTGVMPFWGHPHQHAGRYDHLAPTKNRVAFDVIPEFRRIEAAVRGAKSLWQLCYNGAVGKQSLLGMAHLEHLRQTTELRDHVSIWPFESRFANDLSKPVLIAEVYPSLISPRPEQGEVLDAAQVRSLAERYAVLDANDEFEPLLAAPSLRDSDLEAVLNEEGWIVGAQQRGAR